MFIHPKIKKRDPGKLDSQKGRALTESNSPGSPGVKETNKISAGKEKAMANRKNRHFIRLDGGTRLELNQTNTREPHVNYL